MSFTFHKCLGTGGYGEVYLATLTRPGGLSKRVAVKILKEDLRNADEAVQRLRDEGRMLAILNHPCILRVLEMTLIRGRVALVAEYVNGIDLARCCRQPRLLPHRVLIGAIGEVASALNCAWTTISPETGKPLHLIHRDIKPENIRLGQHGEVKLLDFGIARTTEMFRHAKTAMGDLPFTPGYAPPEAFTKGFQGSKSDVYALGVSLYRLLAGERLYEGMDLASQVTMCCLNERYTPFLRRRLSKLDIPEPIMKLLTQMLAYEADERPTAEQVEAQCVQISEALDGPTHVRWARAMDFPEPNGIPGGTLTGQTVLEDAIHGRRRPSARGVSLRPKPEATHELLQNLPNTKPPAPPSLVTDLTPPLPPPPEPPPQRLPMQSLPPAPPRVDSVRPVTGEIKAVFPTGSAALAEAPQAPKPTSQTSLPQRRSTHQTLDLFMDNPFGESPQPPPPEAEHAVKNLVPPPPSVASVSPSPVVHHESDPAPVVQAKEPIQPRSRTPLLLFLVLCALFVLGISAVAIVIIGGVLFVILL